MRGAQASNAVREFAHKLATAQSESYKINLVKTFPIPNNKEDIFEFMLLASTNFDHMYYASHRDEEDVSDAWLIKIEQCYNKAQILFSKDDPDFLKIREMYEKTKFICNEATKRYNKLVKKRQNADRNRKLTIGAICFAGVLLIIGVVVITILSNMGAINFRSNAIKIELSSSDFIGQSHEEIIALLAEKGFTNITSQENEWSPYLAAGKITDISIDGNNKFYKITKFENDAPIILTHTGYPKDIAIKADISTLIGKNYTVVVDYFEDLGFANVQTKAEAWNPSLSQLSVLKISINGSEQIGSNATFKQDAKVVITYNAKPQEININISSDKLLNQHYDNVVQFFREKGFIDVEVIESTDWDYNFEINFVTKISVNSIENFDANTKFSQDAKIVITYNTSPKSIRIGTNSEGFEGENYQMVLEALKQLGFVDIETNGTTWDYRIDSNVVTAISINGETSFSLNDSFLQDAKIIITFNPPPQEVKIGFSSEDVKGKNYEDIVKLLEDSGFVYIEAKEEAWSLFHKSKTIKTIIINGVEAFVAEDCFSQDAIIQITYYK